MRESDFLALYDEDFDNRSCYETESIASLGQNDQMMSSADFNLISEEADDIDWLEVMVHDPSSVLELASRLQSNAQAVVKRSTTVGDLSTSPAARFIPFQFSRLFGRKKIKICTNTMILPSGSELAKIAPIANRGLSVMTDLVRRAYGISNGVWPRKQDIARYNPEGEKEVVELSRTFESKSTTKRMYVRTCSQLLFLKSVLDILIQEIKEKIRIGQVMSVSNSERERNQFMNFKRNTGCSLIPTQPVRLSYKEGVPSIIKEKTPLSKHDFVNLRTALFASDVSSIAEAKVAIASKHDGKMFLAPRLWLALTMTKSMLSIEEALVYFFPRQIVRGEFQPSRFCPCGSRVNVTRYSFSYHPNCRVPDFFIELLGFERYSDEVRKLSSLRMNRKLLNIETTEMSHHLAQLKEAVDRETPTPTPSISQNQQLLSDIAGPSGHQQNASDDISQAGSEKTDNTMADEWSQLDSVLQSTQINSVKTPGPCVSAESVRSRFRRSSTSSEEEDEFKTATNKRRF